ncbi:MAG: hypothetical protein ACI37T_04975 [Candidatus Gastranaerophilaceae bacterium]
MSENVAFDPGLGKLATDLYTEVYILENDLANMPQLPRRIRYFRISYKRIVKALLNNIAFYKGCLAWAYYIVNQFPNSYLTGNPFTSLSEEQRAQYAPTELVDFCIEYLPKFYSDLKYYNVKNVILPEDTEYILNTYRKFVVINEGFINAHKTSDIQLPEGLSFSKSFDEIKNEIITAIDKQDISNLINI